MNDTSTTGLLPALEEEIRTAVGSASSPSWPGSRSGASCTASTAATPVRTRSAGRSPSKSTAAGSNSA
ncbi:hypothetical protein NKH18_32575 [Streptomyces sp. M10(2022)]